MITYVIMNADTIIQDVEALLSINVKTSERLGLSTLALITVPRAKMMLRDIRLYKKAKERSKSKHITKEPAWLDNPE